MMRVFERERQIERERDFSILLVFKHKTTSYTLEISNSRARLRNVEDAAADADALGVDFGNERAGAYRNHEIDVSLTIKELSLNVHI